jgi:hypothetical protein
MEVSKHMTRLKNDPKGGHLMSKGFILSGLVAAKVVFVGTLKLQSFLTPQKATTAKIKHP